MSTTTRPYPVYIVRVKGGQVIIRCTDLLNAWDYADRYHGTVELEPRQDESMLTAEESAAIDAIYAAGAERTPQMVYDMAIAPLLNQAGRLLIQHRMPFLCLVQVVPGVIAATSVLPPGEVCEQLGAVSGAWELVKAVGGPTTRPTAVEPQAGEVTT